MLDIHVFNFISIQEYKVTREVQYFMVSSKNSFSFHDAV